MPQVQKLRPEDTAYFMANDAACVQKTCHLRTRVSKTNKQDVSCFKLSCCPPALVSDGTLNLQKQSFLFVIKSNPAPFYPKQRSVRVENNKQNTRTEVGRKPTRNTPGGSKEILAIRLLQRGGREEEDVSVTSSSEPKLDTKAISRAMV
jgi:hypothetical protein